MVVVNEDFALRIPANLKPEVAAPMLRAGATTYSPLKHWGVKAGDKMGVIGFGGLGDMAVKIAKAMGTQVTLLNTTRVKLEEATGLVIRGVLESDRGAMKELRSSFDFMFSTIPEKHDISPLIE